MKKQIFIIVILLFILVGCKNKAIDQYTMCFIDDDGVIIDSYNIDEDEIIRVPNYHINKHDQEYDYIFNGWLGLEKGDVATKNETFVASYVKTKRLYEIIFEANGGTLVEGKSLQHLEYQEMPITPVFEKEDCVFIGFDVEVDKVTTDTTYIAQYRKLTISKISSLDLVSEIKFGWNFVRGVSQKYDDGAIFDELLKVGINAIQVPINWCTYSDDDFNIDIDTLIRLQEIVDAAVERDMYIIIGSYDSYDDTWATLNYNNYKKLMATTVKIWTQIGEYFEGYDEHLLFEYLNEPRDYVTNDTVGYTEAISNILNDANQLFVDTIRNLGGNNKYRHLLITTYWSTFSQKIINDFIIPDDERVIINLHNYAPFKLVHDNSYTTTSWSEKAADYQIELQNDMKMIYDNFISKQIPVLLTEFASRDKNNTPERAKWLRYYLSLAENYGLPCFWWDTGTYTTETSQTFSLFDRADNTWLFPELTEVIEEIFVQKEILPFYKEANQTTYYMGEEAIFPQEMTNLLTGEKENITLEYDSNFFEVIENKIWPKKLGKSVLSFTINDYTYYYQVNILASYRKITADFGLKTEKNDQNIQQCYITTKGNDTSRLLYDWYSSDESIIRINIYSSISILKDGTVGIIAIHKETGAVGVLEIVIENGVIVSQNSNFID
ncbi:MAG: glycoside hydrolase family 5 protein [Bacilli bacterium]|nr:glycoside hydrolase family 5 protein [Bacilli bacterium]